MCEYIEKGKEENHKAVELIERNERWLEDCGLD